MVIDGWQLWVAFGSIIFTLFGASAGLLFQGQVILKGSDPLRRTPEIERIGKIAILSAIFFFAAGMLWFVIALSKTITEANLLTTVLGLLVAILTGIIFWFLIRRI